MFQYVEPLHRQGGILRFLKYKVGGPHIHIQYDISELKTEYSRILFDKGVFPEEY